MDKKIILPLKYRPKNFEELIGQESMVLSLKSALKKNKLHNAYILTGIRGVGKTTTARIISKAINCNKHFEHGVQAEIFRSGPQRARHRLQPRK